MPDAPLRRVEVTRAPGQLTTNTIPAVHRGPQEIRGYTISACPYSRNLHLMNTSLHPLREYTSPTELRRLSLFNRLALYGGLALLRWAHRGQASSEPTYGRLVRDPRRPLDQAAERRELVAACHRLHGVG